MFDYVSTFFMLQKEEQYGTKYWVQPISLKGTLLKKSRKYVSKIYKVQYIGYEVKIIS